MPSTLRGVPRRENEGDVPLAASWRKKNLRSGMPLPSLSNRKNNRRSPSAMGPQGAGSIPCRGREWQGKAVKTAQTRLKSGQVEGLFLAHKKAVTLDRLMLCCEVEDGGIEPLTSCMPCKRGARLSKV